ncbi:hypothetical protein [Citrobacter braakii]|uniref:hypothetical protein n=1 Tax=Citrobacter braakii TaxID=57706 RepID=UPI000B8EAF68|nr:hypothetical protein [Citrobacter braakii]
MKEHGMIFNGEMVRALLDGRKTQTRRPVKPQPELTERSGFSWNGALYGAGSDERETNRNFAHAKCPYGKPGDRIWVRETFSTVPDHDEPTGCSALLYAADSNGPYGKWTPSIHMPRWAARILLEITDVRVERLNSISEEDCWAEGIEVVDGLFENTEIIDMALKIGCCVEDSKPMFALLWQSIYGADSWQATPWVWVVEFKRIEGGAA